MPIYEFYCDSCNVIFNFLASRVDTKTRPDCPRCGQKKLSRQISTFATLKAEQREEGTELAGLDEAKMEQAFASLMQQAGGMNEEDPQQMASLMRKFSADSGVHLGEVMDEAISRMEAGEDPEQIEKEMGDVLSEDDFSLENLQKRVRKSHQRPIHDEKLYTL